MSLDVFTPPQQPSVGSSVSWKARLIENTFGDGYRQTAPDGLNALEATVSLSWDVLPVAYAASIEAFFIGHIGRAFTWTPPGYTTPMGFECSAWVRSNVTGPFDKITATFAQRFDLG